MSSSIRIGVFIPNGAQTLDVACIDVVGSMSHAYFSGMSNMLPRHLIAIAPEVSIVYITSPKMGSLVPLTSSMTLKATNFYTDEEVRPGELDIVMVPGPDPNATFEEEALEWLRGHSSTRGVDILCVCTGIFLCASAGIVDGKSASGPRGLQDLLKKKFPKVELVGENQRWAQDGNFWSSGGITNGNDLMAAYAKSCGRWPVPVAEMGAMLTDVGDRGQFYEQGQKRFVLGIVWSIIKAWFVRPGGGKTKSV
jgi:putative intracellular protease/amidase